MNKTARILVVDDEELALRNISKVLQREEWKCYTFTDPTQALEDIKERDYDIALLDFRMPQIDGIELMREIRTLQKDIDVIFVTAYASHESLCEALRLGAVDYLMRPFRLPHLVDVVKRALSVRRSRAQLNGVHELIGKLGDTQDRLEVVMEDLLESTAAACKADLIYLVVRHDGQRFGADGDAWRILPCRGLDDPSLMRAQECIDRGLEWEAKGNRRPIIVPDMSTRPRRFHGISSALVVPMLLDGIFMGAFYIGSHQKAHFTDTPDHDNFPRTQEDLRFVNIMAGLGATAIRRVHDAEALHQKNLQVLKKEVEVSKKRDEAEYEKKVSRWMIHAVKNRNWVIAGRAKLLCEVSQTDENRQGLDVILRNAQEIDQILERFRYVSMKSRIHRRPTHLHRFIASIIDAAKDVPMLSTITVKTYYDEQLGTVDIDPIEMREVLFNLIDNSLKAMPWGGILELKTQRDDDRFKIFVRDTGCGISKKDQPSLFMPFFSTHNGLGLGLWVAKQGVYNHGGNITLESAVGEGTTVTIELPLGDDTNGGQEITQGKF